MSFTDLCRAAVPLAVNLSIVGSLIALGVALALRLTRAASPRARYLVVVVAFLAAALLPGLATFRAGGPEVRPLASVLVDPPTSEARSRPPGDGRSAPAFSDPRRQHPTYFEERFGTVVDRLAESRLGTWFCAGWLLGAACLLARVAIGYALLTRSRRRWRPASDALRAQLEWPEGIGLSVDEAEGPCTVGLVRAEVVLPARLFRELSPNAVLRVADHERAHAQWRDPLVSGLLRVVAALLWPSVPLWVLLRRAVVEREAAADAAAVGISADSAHVARAVEDYASSLLAIARWPSRSRGARHLTAPIIDGSPFEARIARLLTGSAPPSPTREVLAAGLLSCTVFATLLLPLSSSASDLSAALATRRARIEERVLEALSRKASTPSDVASTSQRATQATITLIGSLQARDWRLTGATKAAFDVLESSRTIAPLLETLRDDDRRVRERSAWALGRLHDPNAVEPLIASLTDQADEVRHTAAWALGTIGDRRAVEPLTANLADPHFEARHAAAWALGEIGDPRAVGPLIAAIKDESADVRHGAAWALGTIADARAREGLATVAGQDADPDVRKVANVALGQLLPHPTRGR